MLGIYVNELKVPYAAAIAMGYKPIETRSKNMLKSIIGERVAIIRTRKGKSPVVVGYATIEKAVYHTKEELENMRDKTLIPPGSKYDCSGKGKWCYYMIDAETCEPFIPVVKVNHGRSYCEF